MRRIIVGVTVLLLVVSGLAFPPKGNSQEDEIGFIKAWETPSEEYIFMDTAVTKDGKVYGINTDHYGTAKNRLMCIENGKIVWTGEENFFRNYLWWDTFLYENTVIAAGVSYKEDIDSSFPLMVCYTLDGKKVWERKLEQKEYVSLYALHKEKIWLLSEKVVYVLDPKTGTELKKIDLSKDFPSPPPDDEEVIPEPSENKRLRELYIRLNGDCAFLFDYNFLKNYQIKDDLSLEFRWEKAMPKDSEGKRSLSMNMGTWFQANEDFFLSFDSEDQLVCYDSKTCKVQWEMTQEYICYSYINYRKNYLFITDRRNTNCYNFADQKLLWTKEGAGFPLYYTEKTVYLASFDRGDGFSLELVRLRTGGTIAKVEEIGSRMFIVDGDDVFFLKKHGVSKYSMCNPCACKINVSWKDNGKDSIDLDVCLLEEKQLEIELSNPNDKAIVDCLFGRVSDMMMLSQQLVSLAPGEKKIVTVKYAVGMTMPEQLMEKIVITTNCNQTFTLTLKIKKASNCKEKLKKSWTIDGSTFYAFDKVLVKAEYTSSGWFSSNLSSFTGYNSNTGKALWTLPVKSVIAADGANIVDLIGNLFIIEFNGKSKDKWAAVDGVTGKVVWKRPAGIPAKYGESFSTNCEEGKTSITLDLFNPLTGKTIISKLKVDCPSSVEVVCKIGQNYLLHVYNEDKREESDVPTYWFVRTDGKVYWRKNLSPCLMENNFEYDSFYVKRNLEPEKELEKYSKFKIAKLDPIKLKEQWSITVDGWPYIVLQYKTKVVFHSYGGIVCLNPADGKKLWGFGDSTHGMSDPVIAKGLIFSQTWNRDEKNPEKNKMYAIDPNTGKNTHEMEFDWYADYHWDGKYFYIIDKNWSQKPQKNTVQCIDLDGWKTLWTATGYGDLKVIGEKMIFDDDQKLTWFDKGQQIGSYDIGTLNKDDHDFSSSQFVWEGDIVYKKDNNTLWAIDAKTSALLLKLQNIGYERGADIIYTYSDYHDPESYRTPCYYEGKVFYSNGGKLVAYELLK